MAVLFNIRILINILMSHILNHYIYSIRLHELNLRLNTFFICILHILEQIKNEAVCQYF